MVQAKDQYTYDYSSQKLYFKIAVTWLLNFVVCPLQIIYDYFDSSFLSLHLTIHFYVDYQLFHEYFILIIAFMAFEHYFIDDDYQTFSSFQWLLNFHSYQMPFNAFFQFLSYLSTNVFEMEHRRLLLFETSLFQFHVCNNCTNYLHHQLENILLSHCSFQIIYDCIFYYLINNPDIHKMYQKMNALVITENYSIVIYDACVCDCYFCDNVYSKSVILSSFYYQYAHDHIITC